jgi:hypothetical protein
VKDGLLPVGPGEERGGQEGGQVAPCQGPDHAPHSLRHETVVRGLGGAGRFPVRTGREATVMGVLS